MNLKKGLFALSPLVVFLVVYLLSSIIAGDFYKVPICSAFLISCVYAVLTTKGKLSQRLEIFSKGAGHPNILLMIWIFILAGAFAGTAKDIGAVQATVSLTLSLIPARALYTGLFLTACFISMSLGTSVGTIVALVPIASGIATQAGIGVEFMAAIIVGGAFFGDNLSFISDTTIAATRAAGCEMHQKFKTNIQIILPAVIIVSVLYVVLGWNLQIERPDFESVNPIKLIPYILVIVLALLRAHVTVVLISGILLNAVIGFVYGDFTWVSWLVSIGGGISSMSELIIVTLLAGGLLEMIRHNGGLDFIIERLTRRVNGRRGAQASIAALVSLANVCTANNTIAIITTGGISSDIGKRFGIAPRKVASILDTFSCLIQGLLPYGAQLLMASSLAQISSSAIIPYLYYPFVMGFFAILSIIFDYPKK
ncbi:MAG: Na+/H+ antiporter NhaC family protein [Candidatus Cryptobacteroides sp.]